MQKAKGISFVADSFDRVETCSFLGRIPAEEDSGDGADGEGQHHRIYLDIDRPVGYEIYKP